jgi:hypothetical protein
MGGHFLFSFLRGINRLDLINCLVDKCPFPAYRDTIMRGAYMLNVFQRPNKIYWSND